MRAMLVAVTVTLVGVALGCGGSGDETVAGAVARYTDAVGESGDLPDIRGIKVTSTADGLITFRVTLGHFSSGSKTAVDLWLDADADPETGNTTFDDAGGAEFQFGGLLGDPAPDPSCEGNVCFSEWSPTGWIPGSAPTASVKRTAAGATFSINRKDLGDTDELNFYAIVGGDPPERAPGRGTFNYSLVLGGPRPEASSTEAEGSDKAGGTPERTPVVLTLAEHNYNAVEPEEFAAAVERLSEGTLRIEITNGYRYYDVDYESAMIDDVRSGVFDLTHVGARAWDAAGVKSFNALVAPLLVDSYALERRVLESDVVERMLDGVEPLGLVGLAVVPAELRRPLGMTRALLRPRDYRGARVGIRPSVVADATFDGLGANAEGFSATPEGLAGFDGAESGVATIKGNGYDDDARALTANVVLWPRTGTIVMNRKAFDALTEEQQDVLRAAGAEILEPVLANVEASEAEALSAICEGSHLPLVAASSADRAALRRAVQPVYDELERDSLTRELIAKIEELSQNEIGAADEPLRCPTAHRRSDSRALQGLWRVTVTREELLAAGAQLEQLERAQGSWTVEFDHGGWIARHRDTGNVYSGVYTVDGDVLRETVRWCSPTNVCQRGNIESYGWSVYRNRLTLAPIRGRFYNLAAVVKPLTRVR